MNHPLATAADEWDRRWQAEDGRADWLEPEREVIATAEQCHAAGGRVAHQENFAPGGVAEAADEAQYFARGNTLFQNQGDGTFSDISESAGVTMGRWAWGAEFIDFNNDGLDDIFVPNGYITNHTTKDL